MEKLKAYLLDLQERLMDQGEDKLDGIGLPRLLKNYAKRWAKGKYRMLNSVFREDYEPLISVVIPACNEEEYIADTIKSVLSQGYRNLEVIVVDNGSDDGTAEAVRKASDHRVQIYQLGERGISRARNYGASMATGEIIAFLDSGTRMGYNTLDQIATSYLKGSDGGSGWISLDSYNADASAWSNTAALASAISSVGPVIASPGAFQYISRAGWERVRRRYGGFDESLKSGEDTDFRRKMGEMGAIDYLAFSGVKESDRRFRKEGVGPSIKRSVKSLLGQTLIPGLDPRKEEYALAT
ncbi:MAG: glycosyltransferase [Candidatus Aenigmarchaeota archaeon]|nr:glycosyltransferase [Candidatus Aenigmarchaeota archaeon]